MKESIYEMSLHDIIFWGEHTTIRRVPGGWIYYTKSAGGNTATFVPWNNEFQPKSELPPIRITTDYSPTV